MNVKPYDPEELRKTAWDLDKDGRRDDAIAVFQQIVLDHPNTTAALDAQQYLASTSVPLMGRVSSVTPAGSVDPVRVVDIDIAFFSMVGLFVKAAIAVIPATIIIAIVWTTVSGLMGDVLTGIR